MKMKITIVGSMKFHERYEKIKAELERKGYGVITPLPDEAYIEEDNPKRKSMEDFNNNLETSDAILVANFDKDNNSDYIGVNSIMEIGMAFNRNKKIFALNNIPENCKEEFEAIGVVALNGDLNNLR